MHTAIVIAISFALFFALLTNCTNRPAVNTQINVILAVIAFFGGILLYGYGFSYVALHFMEGENLYASLSYAVIRTVHSTLHMFVSANEYADVQQVPVFGKAWMRAIFWVIHTLAFYSTANAFIKLIGVNLIKRIRRRFCRFQDLTLAYGINDKSLELLGSLVPDLKGTLIAIDGEGEIAPYREALEDMGAIVLTGESAKRPDMAFLHSLGIRKGRHHYRIYALHDATSENLAFANQMRKALKQAGVNPSQTQLTMFAGGDVMVGSQIQSSEAHYGYGSVTAFTHADLAARLMIRHRPPYETMTFDEKGYATEDFDAVVIGFGPIGQAALRQLIMNSAFLGKKASFAVFDPALGSKLGSFHYLFPALSDQVDITFYAEDARSDAFFQYLAEHLKTLKYIALCCGGDKVNTEVEQVLRIAISRQEKKAVIVDLSPTEISYLPVGDTVRQRWSLYDKDLLFAPDLDDAAKLLNYQYYKSEKITKEEAWNRCDYFSRMSCLAFTDFCPAFLAMAHTTAEEVVKNGTVSLDPEVFENLSICEHARWNAFNLCNGYQPMPEDTLAMRLAKAKEQRLAGEKPIPPQKDTGERMHACIIPWEGLDALSERVADSLGKKVDYKENDRDNIRIIPELVKGTMKR